jgi:excisionase family DNA binding protein
MSEIFDLIKAFNRLEDKVTVLNAKIDTLLKSPFQKITLDETAACKLLGISPRTLAVLRCEGKIPFLKIRRRTLYRASDLYKYLKDSLQIKEKRSSDAPSP